jgi:uncharacterized protein (TIGR02466 family)
MYRNTVPLFPQGVVSQYHFRDHTFDMSKLETIEIDNERNGVLFSKVNSWKVGSILDQPDFKSIKDFCLHAIEHHITNVEKYSYEDFWISSSWLNFCQPGGYQENHTHGNSVLSGCFYILADTSHPGLTFKKQRIDAGPHLIFGETGDNSYKSEEIEFKIKTNDLLLFSPQLMHGYNKNTSNETRISIAFNVLINPKITEDTRGWYDFQFQK